MSILHNYLTALIPDNLLLEFYSRSFPSKFSESKLQFKKKLTVKIAKKMQNATAINAKRQQNAANVNAIVVDAEFKPAGETPNARK